MAIEQLTDSQIKKNANRFFGKWNGKGDEKQHTIEYWSDIFTDILGIYKPTDYWQTEKKVIVDGNQKYIDIYIPETKVIIEQKSLSKSLDKNITQSGGDELTPYEQAKRYNDNLPTSEKALWIVTCNFSDIWVYNMDTQRPEESVIKINLMDLQTKYHELSFLVNPETKKISEEMEISKKAGDEIDAIYKAILKQYKDAQNPSSDTLKSLNMLCVRLVFCFYAEDSGIFGHKNIFSNYIEHFDAQDLRKAILELFQVLDQDPDKNERDEYLDERLAIFPYVNGGLFTEQDNKIPQFTQEIKDLLIKSGQFMWERISPTIFGAIFESTLNQETRRNGGMHYTSIENIHKVIDPLFMNNLRAEFDQIKEIKVEKTRNEKLKAFQQKLGKLTFFDPACGSGNFLTESFMSLRRLENECIKLQLNGQSLLSTEAEHYIYVDIHQFYGIEINDFAVAVAKTALWIADSQMKIETMQIIDHDMDFLPLQNFENIIEGNALRLDWNLVGESLPLAPADKSSSATPSPRGSAPKTPEKCHTDLFAHNGTHFDYIMGNPPFVGAMWCKGSKRDDIANVFPECKKPGEIDYVAGWYAVASKFIQNTNTKCAFVSTNSITQGQQVALIWKPLFEKYKIRFDFAYRTFRWDSESNEKAKVHCVIIGFSCDEPLKQVQGDSTAVYGDKQPQVATHSDTISCQSAESNCHARADENRTRHSDTTPRHSELVSESHKKYIYDGENKIEAKNINGYLVDADNVYISARKEQISNKSPMHMGSMARDGGFLILSEEEYNDYIKKEPQGKQFIHQYMMGNEFINNIPRYCFWLENANPKEILKCPLLLDRIENVKQARLNSPARETQKLAETPMRFAQLAQPKTKFIAFPSVSSEKRKYIPIGFLTEDIIVGNKIYVIEDLEIVDFGILTSIIHNAWMRAVCGRLEMRYNYSNTIVYNNFPFPTLTDAQKAKITQTAQAILDARALYPDCSLADLYGENMYLFPELVKAHTANDNAVKEAYGFAKDITESEIVAELFKLYEEKVKGE